MDTIVPLMRNRKFIRKYRPVFSYQHEMQLSDTPNNLNRHQVMPDQTHNLDRSLDEGNNMEQDTLPQQDVEPSAGCRPATKQHRACC